MKNEFKHELGSMAEDLITGFKGIIAARSNWISGCNTYGLRPEVDKDGKVLELEWFDENVIFIIKEGVITINKPAEDPGGPQETPCQANKQ